MRHVIGAKVLIQLVHWPYLDCQCGLQSAIADNMLYLLGGAGQDDKASPAVFTAPLDFLFNHQLKWSFHQDLPWLHQYTRKKCVSDGRSKVVRR